MFVPEPLSSGAGPGWPIGMLHPRGLLSVSVLASPSGRQWRPRPTQLLGLGLLLLAGLGARVSIPPVILALAGILLIGLPSLARPRKLGEGPGGPEAPFAGRGKKVAGTVLLAALLVPVGPCVVEAGRSGFHTLFFAVAQGPWGGALGVCPPWVLAAVYAWVLTYFGLACWQRPLELLEQEGPDAVPRRGTA